MHEYSIIQSLVDSVERVVWKTAAPGCPDSGGPLSSTGVVHRIEVRIGELSGVDCELLATAYEVFRTGTICENATMTIDRIPARWCCSKCDADIPPGRALQCGECHEPARLASGDEIILQRIEMEVADVSGLRMR